MLASLAAPTNMTVPCGMLLVSHVWAEQTAGNPQPLVVAGQRVTCQRPSAFLKGAVGNVLVRALVPSRMVCGK